MKRIGLFLLSCALVWNLRGQQAVPAVTPLTAYSGVLQGPARVATDAAGNVYVTDPQAGQVVVFDPFGRQVAAHGDLGRPLAIAVDGQGQIFVSDEQAGSVTVFDARWTQLYQLGIGAGEFKLPNHISPAPNGDEVFVSDSIANVIKAYRGPTLINQIGSPGTGRGQLDFPAGVFVSRDDQVFVLDQNNDRIQVFDTFGAFLRGFSLGVSTPVGRSQATLLDAAQRLYVADAFQGTVRVYDAAYGTLLTSIGDFGEGAGQLSSPGGLALDRFGRLCVASANSRRLEVFGLDSYIHFSASVPGAIIAAGTNLILSATSGETGPLSFQWQRDGQNIPNATNATFSIQDIGSADAGSYSVLVTSSSGTVTSSVASFGVMEPPVLLGGPASASVWRGAEAVLSVQAGGEDLRYQWLRNGLEIPEATDSTLRFADVQPQQAGSYSVRVHNAVGTITSPAALLTVITPPSIMEIVSASVQTDRVFQLTVNGDPGFAFVLEASTDFVDWMPLTNFTNEAGLFEFADTESTNFSRRFYRVQWEH